MISIIIMGFNEAGTLESVTRETFRVLRGLKNPYEIIIINDGSQDNTRSVSEGLVKELENVRVIHHQRNLGLGAVYKTGFSSAKGDLLSFLPADGQFSPALIEKFYPLMKDADMVLGFLPHRHCSILAKLLSKGERILFRLLFGPMPKFQGYMMFRRQLLEKIRLKSQGGQSWTLVMELIIRAKKSGYRIKSVPITLEPRKSGRSKVNNFSTIWANLSQLIGLRLNF